MVGVRGFEPPASASRTQRSSQTEPHPDVQKTVANILALPNTANRQTAFSNLFNVETQIQRKDAEILTQRHKGAETQRFIEFYYGVRVE